jgi:hypothetical protein
VPRKSELSFLSITTPLPVAVPRAAPVAAYYFLKLLGSLASSLQARQAGKAMSTRLKEAAQLRAYAMNMQGMDPRVAADLMAAADRHAP